MQDQLTPALRRVFGFDSFRPGQEEIVRCALEGRDLLAVMPTGSGKSLCFQLPAVVLGGLTLVVSPLIALMNDQVRQLRALGVAAHGLNSGQTAAQNALALRQVREGQARLLYAAPERLVREDTLSLLADSKVRCLVVDEAHCVSQWGHDFRPEYLQLRQVAQALGDCQILAFTATADRATRADIVRQLFSREPDVFVRGFDRPNISLAMSPKQNAKRQIMDFVSARRGRSGIVYCSTRKETEAMAQALEGAGIAALAYHAGMEQSARRANQERFQQEDALVMTATIAFGMGIDKPDVRFVAHASMPKSVEGYYQEIGRAGRDGLPAEAFMLHGLDDIVLRRRQIMEGEADEDQKRVETQRLNALVALCETPRCRRQTLLDYFEEQSPPCGNCDICLQGCPVIDGTVEAQKAMSAMVRTGERFGTEHLVNILTGKQTEAVLRWSHQRLPTFGVGSERTPVFWRGVFRQLLGAGLVSMDIVNHGRWTMTDRGWAVLKGRETFSMRGEALEEPETRAKRKRKSAKDSTDSQGQRDSALFKALKALRFRLAKEQDVPAFVVFSDRTLLDMEARRPSDMEEMADVHGVGEAKLARYGRVFLEVLHEHSAGAKAVDGEGRERAPSD